MSRKAQAWQMDAVRGKGLGPGPKLVMSHLADRHTPEHGCYPGLDRLLEETELRRSTMMRYLNELEEAGLFVRVQRKRTDGRRDLTRFVLAMEDDFEAAQRWVSENDGIEPSPKLGHGEEGSPSPESGPGSMSQNLHVPCPKSDDFEDSTPYRSEQEFEQRAPAHDARAREGETPAAVTFTPLPGLVSALRKPLADEFPDHALAIQAIDAQASEKSIRVIVPNDFLLANLKKTAIPDRLKELIAETGEQRPVLFGVGTNSESPPLPSMGTPRTVASQ